MSVNITFPFPVRKPSAPLEDAESQIEVAYAEITKKQFTVITAKM
jgi:hypothetical protein